MLRLEACIIRNGTFEIAADLSVIQGSRVAIIGPSGGGKTTLLEALAGFTSVSAGGIWWQDNNITEMPPGTETNGDAVSGWQSFSPYDRRTERGAGPAALICGSRPRKDRM